MRGLYGLEPSLLRWLLLASLPLYLALFNPRLRADGVLYHEVLRSLAIDRDVNLDNEREFYSWRYVPLFSQYGVGTFKDTGYPGELFNIGAPLFWYPFFLVGHAAAFLLEGMGAGVVADGYSFPERLATSITSLPLALGGIALTVRLVQAFRRAGGASPGDEEELTLALPAALIVAMASPLPAFVLVTPTFSHPLSYLLAAAFLLKVVETFGRDRASEEDLALGLLLGLAALVRTQCAFLAVALVFEGARRLSLHEPVGRLVRRLSASYLRIGAAALLAFSPQLASNLVIFGKLLVDPQGEGGMHWLAPQLSLVLWDGKHGLYATTPFLLIATLALPLLPARQRWVGAALLLTAAVQFYLNAVRRDWAGVGFGMRRFIELLPIFTLAFAELLWRVRRRMAVAALMALGVMACAWNLALMAQYYLTDLSSPPVRLTFGQVARRNLEHGPALLARLAGRGLVGEALASGLGPGLAHGAALGAALLLVYGAIVAWERSAAFLAGLFPVIVMGLGAVLLTVDAFLIHSRLDTCRVQAFVLDEPRGTGGRGRVAAGTAEAVPQTPDLLWRRKRLTLRRGAPYEGVLGGFILSSGRAGILSAEPSYPGGFLDEATLSTTEWPAREPRLRARAGGTPTVALHLVLSYESYEELPSPVLHLSVLPDDGLREPMMASLTKKGGGFAVTGSAMRLEGRPIDYTGAASQGAVALRLELDRARRVAEVVLAPADGVQGLVVRGLALEEAAP